MVDETRFLPSYAEKPSEGRFLLKILGAHQTVALAVDSDRRRWPQAPFPTFLLLSGSRGRMPGKR